MTQNCQRPSYYIHGRSTIISYLVRQRYQPRFWLQELGSLKCSHAVVSRAGEDLGVSIASL